MTISPTARPVRRAPPGRRPRRGRLTGWLIGLIVVAAVVAGAVVGIRSWWGQSIVQRIDPGCTAAGYRVSTAQAAIASDLVAVVINRSLPARASTLVLTAAIQESKLRNIAAGAGDRDSVGVLQQRPSQGWGTPEELSDPSFAAGAFLDRVVQVPDWQTAPAADVIQAVQISIDGTLYAEHEPEGQALADALDGTSPAGLSCTFEAPTEVAPAATVASRLQAALPIAAPQLNGEQIGVPGAGWPTAAWSVAHADQFGIGQVSYGGRTWSRDKQWTDDTQASSDRVLLTMAANPGGAGGP